MAHREDIGNELKGISRMVGELPQANPFVVPDGFFDGLAERMLGLVLHLEAGSEDAVPVSLLEMKGLPTLQAPDGYFDQFPGQVLARVRSLEAGNADPALPAVLEGLNRYSTYHVPAGYFERFPDEMLALAKSSESVDEELQRLSPLLAKVSRKYPGAVPAGYFEGLASRPAGVGLPVSPFGAEAPAVGLQVQEAPVVSMEPQKRRSVHPFLAAAVTIGVVLVSAVWGYHISLRPTPFIRSGINLKTPAQLSSAMANVSDQAIVDYLKSSTDVTEADLLAASDAEDQQAARPDEIPDGSKVPNTQTIPE